MTRRFDTLRLLAGVFAWVILSSGVARTESAHGLAMYGQPALPADFQALPYVNPDAPKGGRMVFGEPGTFDSLNPHILKGNAPWAVGAHVFESLMARSWDEPFTMYGLLAESIETGPRRDWVRFRLRDSARFSDNSPVTPEDVRWSFETLGTQGHPRYRTAWGKIAGITIEDPLTIRFDFNVEDRELPLIIAYQPILQKAQWQDRDFASSSLVPPIGSGAYVIDAFEPGRFLSLRRNPDYWGRDLAINRGKFNLDELRYDYYGDGDVVFEAFRGGLVDTYRETSAAKWSTGYDFPAARAGQVVRSEIPHRRPSGMRGLVMNTRRGLFADWRVREAMMSVFNFEFISATLNDGLDQRIGSYFSNSPLGMSPDAATGAVRDLLVPYGDQLLPGALEGYRLPVSNGKLDNRKNRARAFDLLAQAGWRVDDSGALRDATGARFSFGILLNKGASEMIQIAELYVLALDAVGIKAVIEQVDTAQFNDRQSQFDFDMTSFRRDLSLSPGNEQYLYWGSAAAGQTGSRNLMGVASPVVDGLIDTMLTTDDPDRFTAATRALDRVLMSGRYVIPIWFASVGRIAHRADLRYPDRLPLYGDWIGFQPDVWWQDRGDD